jgi:hypothetical protein
MREGWVCPKCGNVYAPFVEECFKCNPVEHVKITYNNSDTADDGSMLYCLVCGEFYKNKFHCCNMNELGGY